MKAEIISIGTELLLGEITDTNASFIAGQLPSLGIDLHWVSQVGDNIPRILEVLKRAWGRSDIILTTGGLGPTEDDLTRESIAEMFGEKMAIQPALEAKLRERFARLNMEMPVANLKQATLIPSAKPVPNSQGTAPGWLVEKDGRILIAMPGPPREMQEMWRNEVLPLLQPFAKNVIVTRTIKTFGLSEGAVAELVHPLFECTNPTLGIYAKQDGIQLRLGAKAETRENAEKINAPSEAIIRGVLDKYIWGFDDDTLESVAGGLLLKKSKTLAIMEDYTGGWVTTGMNEVADSQKFFRGGLVASSDEAKVAFRVSRQIIAKFGAVSAEVAQDMAEAARALLKADIGVSITGMKETETWPMGMVYIGLAYGKGRTVTSRSRGRRQASNAALFELRNLLLTSG